ncbi:MAG: zinc-dependent peptidase [Chitinophagaceae bacterium]
MPGDTLIIGLSPDSLPLHQLHPAILPDEAGNNDIAGAVFLISFFAVVVGIPFLFHWLRIKYYQKQAFRAAETALENNYAQYDDWLTAYNGYYQTLPAHLRRRFLERTAWFIATKNFNCVNLAADERMPLLISAASVQISFGLDKYLLDFFDTVYIMRGHYNYGSFEKPFQGHVSSEGIYLSWDNFLKGYENYTDADNVGIHEMAHALAYVNFMAGANSAQDEAFKQRFYDFSAVARPVFNAMQTGATNLLNPYAASNYNEFWAVAVETFFEQPLHMKLQMPDLYTSLCMLLNQDPLTAEKLLTVI